MKIKLRTLIRLRRLQLWVARTEKELNLQLHKHRNQRKLASVLVTVSALSVVCLMTGSAAVPASVPQMCATDAVYYAEEITEVTTEAEEITTEVEETTTEVTEVEESTEATTQIAKVVEETAKAETGKCSEYEIQLLARLVYGEARGESYEGQVAVAAVVLNRVESKGFPNTIKGVVYENSQFSCVGGSAFNKTQSKESSCYKAALAAIAGEDPTGGCLYFYNPKECSPSNWVVTNTTVKKVIGNHNFGVEK